jgi:hypothetical protein
MSASASNPNPTATEASDLLGLIEAAEKLLAVVADIERRRSRRRNTKSTLMECLADMQARRKERSRSRTRSRSKSRSRSRSPSPRRKRAKPVGPRVRSRSTVHKAAKTAAASPAQKTNSAKELQKTRKRSKSVRRN